MDFLKSAVRGICLWKDPGLVDLNNAVIFWGLTMEVLLVLKFIILVLGIVLGLECNR